MWLRKAGASGNSWAAWKLGGLYEFGPSINNKEEPMKAIQWYSKAVKLGRSSAKSDRVIATSKEMQTMLKKEGYYKGKIDGLPWKKTMQAYKKWMASNGGQMVAGGNEVAGGSIWDGEQVAGGESPAPEVSKPLGNCHGHGESKLTNVVQRCHKSPKGGTRIVCLLVSEIKL